MSDQPPPTPAALPTAPDPAELQRACVRLFATPDGRLLMAHLRRTTLDRALGPQAGDAALRMLEGQRALVLSLLTLATPVQYPAMETPR